MITYRRSGFLLALVLTATAGCSTPGSIVAPPSDVVKPRLLMVTGDAQLPRVLTRIHAGDTLRILRDGQDVAALDIRNLVEDSQTLLYVVRTDGSISYRYAGRVEAAGKTPDELASELRTRLTSTYRDPGVTINIVLSPSNKVVVGGAVRTPIALDLNSVATLEQAIFAAGGLLNSADARVVALLRLDAADRYQVYFIDMSQLLTPGDAGRATIALDRGDIVFIPRSGAGDAADAVDLYINQLIPFARTVGVGLNRPF